MAADCTSDPHTSYLHHHLHPITRFEAHELAQTIEEMKTITQNAQTP
jgi:hypothetical protein